MAKESETPEVKKEERIKLQAKKESEDVPEDFFDDFLKEDFMAGLDIVDEDNEVEETPKTVKKEPSKKVENKNDRKKSKLSKTEQELKKLDKKIQEIKQKKPKSDKKLDSDNFDIRRDPEKTRQAIQQDKIKNAKKLINDIVETGLVPPGMELEMDLEEVKQRNSPRKRSRSPKISRKISPKRSPRKLSSTSRKRSRSPRKPTQSPRKTKRSPRKPSRSPQKLSRSPLMQRRRSRSPRRPSRLYSPSPRHRLRRTKSPPSPLYRRSRSRDYRRRRSQSYSPLRRKAPRLRSPPRKMLQEKPSFLEELVAKLNYVPHQQQNLQNCQNYGNYMPAALQPVPVQPPPLVPDSSFFAPPPMQMPMPSAEQYDPYDESFFIGPTPPVVNEPSAVNNQTVPAVKTDEVGKLFNDKRIRLSDFLAITAKPVLSNTTSAKLKEKVKVIQRCQEAIKQLSERKFSGPLFVSQTNSYECSKDVTLSPLLRKPIVQLPFITSGRSGVSSFAQCCEALLHRVGLEKTSIVRKPPPALQPPPLPSQSAPPTPTITPKDVCKKAVTCQTDKELSRCKECLKRKGILYANVGVQASQGPNLTFSVCTQVSEVDFYQMIPRNQSLASLTPAQLLGKQSMVAPSSRLARQQQMPSPPPPPSFFSGFNPQFSTGSSSGGGVGGGFHRY